MDPDTAERLLTNKTLKEVSNGRSYNIDISNLDTTSTLELRRLLRDLHDARFKYKKF